MIVDFIYEKIALLIIHLFSSLALVIFLKLMGLPGGALLIILISWFFLLFIYLFVEYINLKHKQKEISRRLEELDQKYLIAELLDTPDTLLEKLYYRLLKSASKSMIEEVGKVREGQLLYKEYIESWIHEIKTPITAVDLICKNHSTEETKRISKELKDIHYLVEQALFYARSEYVEKDYFISNIRLFDVVHQSLLNNRAALTENYIELIVDETEERVWSDEKWLVFILGQLINNAVKYSKRAAPKLHIYSENTENGIRLILEDNGIGISMAELPRIFEKGFTGINRTKNKSTGMGLYLCKKLCDKLGLGIFAEAEEGLFTRIILSFPIGKLTKEYTEAFQNDQGLTKV